MSRINIETIREFFRRDVNVATTYNYATPFKDYINQKKEEVKENMSSLWYFSCPKTGEKLVEVTKDLEVKVSSKLTGTELAAGFWNAVKSYLPRETNQAIRDRRSLIVAWAALKAHKNASDAESREAADKLMAEAQKELEKTFY